MSNNKTQISPIPPEGYGDRFVKFITGITKPRDEAIDPPGDGRDSNVAMTEQLNSRIAHSSTDQIMQGAERQARKTERQGATEDETPYRVLSSARSPSADRGGSMTLPVVEEAAESGSTGGDRSREREPITPSRSNNFSSPLGGRPPPTPPKDEFVTEKALPSLPKFDQPGLRLVPGEQATR